jgi:hypothetical protein
MMIEAMMKMICYDGDAYGGSGEIDNTYHEC